MLIKKSVERLNPNSNVVNLKYLTFNMFKKQKHKHSVEQDLRKIQARAAIFFLVPRDPLPRGRWDERVKENSYQCEYVTSLRDRLDRISG